jgi:Tol biopolymer transport system component
MEHSVSEPLPSRIGAYPIEREVGRGGMGIVYLGRDTRLDRPVAIKVLPDAFASDPDRLTRFEREARLLASLSHPNIAGIFGLEEADGRRFLVLEYVEGETLAQRIVRGPIPVDDAVDLCRQIASALEAAHEGGVIHRDLKPGNVKLTPSGEVKVLDFGLAKGGTGSGASSDPSMSASPTIAVSAATGVGVILGTAAYMSPEQARGRAVDRRTDIWSFGCVLYECLTGRQAFEGETVSDMIAMILQGQPDWSALPANVPSRIRDLIARCLTKDAKKRLRDIGEARLVLEGGDLPAASGVSIGAAANAGARPASRVPYAVAAVFALSTLALGALMVLRAPAPQPVLRLALPVPPTPVPGPDACYASLSPDGSVLATTAADSAGSANIWLRPLDGADGRTLPGTGDGLLPFWSPDGRYLVFTTQDKLKKLDLRGGSPEVLCPVTSYGRGGSWGSQDVIVFAAGSEGPLFKVSKDGGTPEQVTTLDSLETGHRFPSFLPDGRHFLYASMPPRNLLFTIYVGSIDSRKRERLMSADGTPVYVEPGYLLYTRNGRIVAQRFDARARKLIGEPVPLVDEPRPTDYLGSPSLIAAVRGPLAYFRQVPQLARIAWFDRSGRETERLPLAPGPYESIALSPDARRAVVVRRTSPSESDLWLVDLRGMSMTRLVHGPGRVDRPVWSPDGARVAFSTDREGHWDIYEKIVDGSDAEQPIVKGGSLLKYPDAWSADGQTLVFEQISEKSGWDLYAVSPHGDRTPRPLFATPFDEQYAALSADGRWIAYASNESGRSEIYVQAYPSLGARHQISESGGAYPSLRSDGREIFWYSNRTSALIMSMGPDGARGPEKPQPFQPVEEFLWLDPKTDFSRVIGLVRVAESRASDDLTIVLNWRAELARR